MVYILTGSFADIEKWKDVSLYEMDQMLQVVEWAKEQERQAYEKARRNNS
ncbi:hypothetical protein [Moorena sp. SIO3A2]|nr:hypothetical protein [Moorena sp. SIO3A2]NER90351.1 hypothetical protein [Moorena sp. SIO3A2]